MKTVKPKDSKLTIHEYALIFISLSAITAAGMLALKIFNPYCTLLISLTLTTALAYKLKIKKFNLNLKNNYILVIILLIGIIIRLKPHLYIMGGQDQGTYVSMAKQYLGEGKLYVIDEYRETLNEQQQQVYDERGNYIMPSFEKWNRPNSEYSMVFYPVHPALLSLSGSVLGMSNSVYLLAVTSTLTLINIYLITNLITKNKKTSLIVLLLFTLNPVHVFMSKYPVGETTALFFITSGYYFLLKYLKQKENILYLAASILSFMAFSLTRMTFFIHIPVIILLTVYNKKSQKEKIMLGIYALVNLFILAFSYLYYRTFQYPLFNKLYGKTIGKLLINYVPTDIPNNIKIILIFVVIGLVLIGSLWEKIYKPAEKILPFILSITALVLAFKIKNRTVTSFARLIRPEANYLARYNIVFQRGSDLIKHVPIFSVANYVGHFILIAFIGLLIYNLIKLGKTKYTLLSFIAVYFSFVYLSRTYVMRYDYYNSRYYLTEIVPAILLTTGIFLSGLISKGGWHKKIAITILSTTLIYFSIFSFFQIGKVEGNEMDFYNKIDSTVSDQNLIIFVNQNIYDSKYPKNFNDYVAGPLKYFFDKKVLVLEHPEEITTPIVQSFFNKHPNVYYISNVPLESYEFASQEQKMTFDYNYFNNSPGCNYHNYEFLRIDNITEIPLPDSLKCKLLPNAYYERSRDYYFGELLY